MSDYNILIVEDIFTARSLYKQALEQASYLTIGVETGKEALSVVKKEAVSLVILDFKLPDMNGDELLKEIRQIKPNIPVLVLTAFSDRETIFDMLNIGVNDYLVKPVNLDNLRRRVFEVLEGDKRRIIGKDKLVQKTTRVKAESKEKMKYLWKKEIICPICGTNFTAYNYKKKSQTLLETETDFHEIYEEIDPIMYDIWVCPHCYYSAKAADFEKIQLFDIRIMSKDKRKSKYDFKTIRTNQSALESFKLALHCYNKFDGTNVSTMANLYLKTAWLYRGEGDAEREKKYLTFAAQAFEKKYLSADKVSGRLSENGLAYLIGELYKRIGKKKEAMKYFKTVLEDRTAKKEKLIYEKTKRQYEELKNEGIS